MTVYLRDTCFKTIAKYENIKLVTWKGLKFCFIKEDNKKIYIKRPQLSDFVVKEK